MTCRERIDELVEYARRTECDGSGVEPDRELRAHLSLCEHCRDRWDAELRLTSQLRTIRGAVAALRSPGDFSRIRSRESLMRDFSRIHRHTAAPSWTWALAAAAALLLAAFLGHMWGQSGEKPAREVRKGQAVLYDASIALSNLSNLSNDASALSSDDFIAVPYTPPLAPGEMVRVVHADLYPEALASMGVEVDPSWVDRLPADVVVGEDGLPRAVRIADNGQF
jgi:hypothetical protein